MKFVSRIFPAITIATAAVAAALAAHAQNQSQWVGVAPDGALTYKTTPQGDRIMDFSSAGYMGGGVAFPNMPVRQTVRPPAGNTDATDAIQAAIDAVAALPLDTNGHRGAVLLASGTFYCSREIRIHTSGIVLRGSGSDGKNATIIWMTGAQRHPAININRDRTDRRDNTATPAAPAPTGNREPRAANRGGSATARTTITDAYVPSGASTFTVASAAGFAPGDIIEIRRPTTAEWVRFMGMDTMTRNASTSPNGPRFQTWLGLGRTSIHIRRIVSIGAAAPTVNRDLSACNAQAEPGTANRAGSTAATITLDAPLSDSFDARHLGKNAVEIVRIAGAEPVLPISQVGVERLRIECPPLEIEYGNAPCAGIRVGGQDCWVDDVRCVETMNTMPITGRRVTIRNTHVTHTHPNLGASKPADFSIEGSQILIDQCSSDGANTYWVWTNSYDTGPNVVLNSNFTGRGSRIQPHQRWATGFLVDNCRTPDGGIDLANRGVAGSGHGWSIGWGVVWNSTAKTFIIQNPPGSANWAIGCIGGRQQTARYFDTAPLLPEGIIESHGAHVAPRSLYLAQLAARLGPGALAAIGYAPGAPAALALENPAMPAPRPQPATPIDAGLGENLAFLRPVNTSGFAISDTADPRKYAGEKALDGDPATHWIAGTGRAPASGRSPATPHLEIDTEGPLDINALTLSEPAESAGAARVLAYKIEGQIDSDYTLLAEGATIGARKVHTFPKVTVWKMRLTILKTEGGAPAISEFTLHCK